MRTLKEKLTSRKFWISAAAFLAGIAGVITGLSTDNETLTIIGAVCTAISTAIYDICETVTDKAEADEFTFTGTVDADATDEADSAEEETE